ncbi:TraA family conjugative transfer protein [Rheinheimera hassiensis]|uniref:TraA family conjugative transfer protein n=1 Tax=Rheinheimera hassiensis TaxID=1193627 RepID=UPI001F0676B8|nr:TraA family conjugative transfer protein [Rheinheimera hassiensis]
MQFNTQRQALMLTNCTGKDMKLIPNFKASIKKIATRKNAALALLITLFAGAAAAGSGGAEFEPMYDQIADWLDGAPGKSVAVLAFGFSMFNVMRQNFTAAIGAFVGCLLMANAKTVIESFLTAGLPL